MLSLLLVLASVIFLDAVLSGDNAVVVGMAANTLPETERNGAIVFGMAFAALARIILCLFAVALLQYRFVAIVGGFTLLIVAGKLAKDNWDAKAGCTEDKEPPKSGKTFWMTIGIIALADISMSLDNILAVAAIARNNPIVMVLGLICSIAMVGLGAKLVSSLLDKWRWLSWVGVGLITLVAFELMLGVRAL